VCICWNCNRDLLCLPSFLQICSALDAHAEKNACCCFRRIIFFHSLPPSSLSAFRSTYLMHADVGSSLEQDIWSGPRSLAGCQEGNWYQIFKYDRAPVRCKNNWTLLERVEWAEEQRAFLSEPKFEGGARAVSEPNPSWQTFSLVWARSVLCVYREAHSRDGELLFCACPITDLPFSTWLFGCMPTRSYLVEIFVHVRSKFVSLPGERNIYFGNETKP